MPVNLALSSITDAVSARVFTGRSMYMPRLFFADGPVWQSVTLAGVLEDAASAPMHEDALPCVPTLAALTP